MSGTQALLTQAEQAAEERHRLTVAKFSLVVGVTSWIATWFSAHDDLTTPWDDVMLPLVSTLYIVTGLAALLRPQWATLAIATSLALTALNEQGVFFVAAHLPSQAAYYTAAGSGPWFPLIYVVMFVVFPRSATRWAWLHYALFTLQFVLNETLLPPVSLEGAHLLVEVLMSHPIYILALSVIVQLHERLRIAREAALRDKENFLALLSHEIRNRLQTMVGSIDLLDARIDDPAQRRSVERLSKATAQLQTYLNDITEFTRLEDPDMGIEAQPFDAVRMLEELHEEWLPQAEARGLELELRIDEAARERLRSIVIDESRLRQVLGNLISNAIKYTPVGSVTICAGLSAQSSDHPGCIRLEVADTGIGIDGSALAKIFQPYVRLEEAKRRVAEGSGLGLAVVERLVARLGGRLDVASELGQGSRFAVELPADEKS